MPGGRIDYVGYSGNLENTFEIFTGRNMTQLCSAVLCHGFSGTGKTRTYQTANVYQPPTKCCYNGFNIINGLKASPSSPSFLSMNAGSQKKKGVALSTAHFSFIWL